MGLRLIYGRAGTGKSEKCYKEISEKIKQNNKILIITPEQFSFTAEKKLMEAIETEAVFNAEVVTFSRMAYRVIQEIGGRTETNLSKCGKAMLIYSILNNCKKNLKFLGKTDENVDMAGTAITEFKKHGISVEQLKQETEKQSDIYLKNKLNDINMIYEKFQEQIAGKYIDETDLLTILAQNVDKVPDFKDNLIYIDEFAGFTSQEYDIIQKLVKIAKQVTITICTDTIHEIKNADTDIFYSNQITINKLLQLASENDIKIEEVELEQTYRFKTPELKHLEQNLYNPKVIRSTMGSIYRMPVMQADLLEILPVLKENKIQTYAAHLKGKNWYHEEDYTEGTAFFIGNEGNGLSDELSDSADCLIKIPMEGKVESLNAAMAAGILMYETARQRRTGR